MKILTDYLTTAASVFIGLWLVVHAHTLALIVAVVGTAVVLVIAAVDLCGRLHRRSGGAQ